ncbi:hypothetical protein [Halorarum salinum]|uniref:Uncharacterized protein n=1 Tax=Halorarum salinum TaxID=2743089 RepID=A0A7D5L8C1_9EURY|nr:hypothetical protein [Halobaculum salinum]QLG60374.1 hypothetical protein HUG12_00845 [Halobaculum salinum]
MSESAYADGEIADRRKRIVLTLEAIETPVTVDRLADELEDAGPSPVGGIGRDQSWADLHERLHDEDLPALDGAGLIVFDVDRGLVSRRGADENRYVLEGRSAPDRGSAAIPVDAGVDRGDWAAYYLGAVVLSALLLAGVATSFGPLARVSPTVASGSIVGLFGLLAVLDAVRH